MGGGSRVTPREVVRMLILNKNREVVCMVRSSRGWDLPRFEYEGSKSSHDQLADCHRDLRAWFGEAMGAFNFSFMTELIGSQFALNDNGVKRSVTLKLLLVELHADQEISDMFLPCGAAWKDSIFVDDILSKRKVHRTVIEIARDCMSPKSGILQRLTDPRYMYGWYKRASAFLTETARADGALITGNVVQHHLKTTSTMLKINTSKGWYFLKAPAVGCNEVQITSEVALLFPNRVPGVIGKSTSLNCFILREFEYLPADEKDLHLVLQHLAEVQHASIGYLPQLVGSGCPVRELDSLLRQIDMWIEGRGIMAGPMCESARHQLVALLPTVKEWGKQLSCYNIPNTLVHGDVYFPNVTKSSDAATSPEDLLLFDWQFAYIGHPFCDFHRLHKDASEQVINEYLQSWVGFETIGRAREAFDKGWKLGWFFKLMSLAEWYQACNAQWRSVLQMWMLDLVENLYEFENM